MFPKLSETETSLAEIEPAFLSALLISVVPLHHWHVPATRCLVRIKNTITPHSITVKLCAEEYHENWKTMVGNIFAQPLECDVSVRNKVTA